jgi:hypothetical protein
MYEELYELLTDTMEPEEALKWMQDLVDKIDNDPGEAIGELDNFIHDTAINHNLCPHCFTELLTKKYKQTSEFWGSPATEDIYVTVCPDCQIEID